MIRTTPAGATSATSYPTTYEIVEKLTKHYCANGIKPVVSKNWSVADTTLVGSTLYAVIQCIISITYKPKGSCNNQFVTNTFVESFNVSFGGASSSSTIAVVDTDGYSEPTYVCSNNCNNAQGLKNVGSLSITITT